MLRIHDFLFASYLKFWKQFHFNVKWKSWLENDGSQFKTKMKKILILQSSNPIWSKKIICSRDSTKADARPKQKNDLTILGKNKRIFYSQFIYIFYKVSLILIFRCANAAGAVVRNLLDRLSRPTRCFCKRTIGRPFWPIVPKTNVRPKNFGRPSFNC